MKEQAISKINKIGKISSIVTMITKILVGVGLVCSLVGAVICFVFPEDIFKMSVEGDVIMEVNFESMGIELTEADVQEAQEHARWELTGDEGDFSEVSFSQEKMVMTGIYDGFSFAMGDLRGILVLVVITLIMTFITLLFVGELCKAFRDCRSPFEEEVIKKMQKLGYALIPWTIVATVSNSLTDSIMNHKISLSFTLDMGVILIVLIVLVLVHIFKYGAVLQQESDETL